MENHLAVESLLGEMKTSILNYVGESEHSMGELSEFLSINKTAVKEHMDSLERMGYVRGFFQKEKSGRPSKHYEITDKGIELFPKKYAELSTILLDEIQKTLGQDQMNGILAKVADRMVHQAGFSEENDQGNSREEKVSRLRGFVQTLNRMGYYARMEVEGDTVRIIRHNCIFYELARTNSTVVCGVLGNSVIKESGERDFKITERFSDGGNKCVVEVGI
ncbi:MAG: helix-turn-helix transcriptional regulator [Thermoplasmataceae archaeon]